MAGRAKLKKGDILGQWTLTEFVASGGNGDVWFVESHGHEAALKVLHRVGQSDYDRFKREVTICSGLTDGAGVLPITGAPHLPSRQTETDRAWYVMPRATPLAIAMQGKTLDERVAAIATVTTTLGNLLEMLGLHHRDLKVENLFVNEGRVVVGDWGLAKGIDHPDLTEPGKIAGPIHQLAPELLAGDADPDLEKVDVYYVAITLWRLASEKPNTPRGHVRAHEADSVALLLPGESNIAELATIIDRATSRSPESRPTLRQLQGELEQWLSVREKLANAESRHAVFAERYQMAEVRNRAVFDWLLNQVRTQPVFDGSAYDVAEPDAPDPDLPGLTEGQVGTALSDLIERYFVEGEPRLVMGRREPRFYDNLYPSAVGLAEFEDVERLLEEALPLLEAFVEPVDGISLPRDTTPAEIAGGVVRTSAEAYFEMRLLEAYELLSFERLNETGGHATFMNVRATARGRQVLYQIATGP